MKKILWFDTETTGINSQKHGLIQLAGMIEIDGEIKEEFNFKIAPFDTDEVTDEALLVSGTTREDLKTYMSPRAAFVKVEQLFDKYIDRFDKTDKFYPAGYNTRFDLEFLNAFFKKNFNDYFGSYCNWRVLDVLAIMHLLDFKDKVQLLNYKLSTCCEHYGIEIQAHDALSDIKATRELLNKLILPI